eukprot:6491672-Amphidinium_carterae.1
MTLQTGRAERKYRLAVAASEELEDKFYARLATAFSDKLTWASIPASACTHAFRALSFRTLSRIGSTVESALAAEPECMKDPYNLKLQQIYPGLHSPELLGLLQLQGSQQAVDISGIESRHASIRRDLVVKSTQAWTTGLREISSEFMLQSFRTKHTIWRRKKVPRMKEPTFSSASREQFVRHDFPSANFPWSQLEVKRKALKQKKVKQGGGAWRTFIRAVAKHSSEGRPDLCAIARQCRQERQDRTPLFQQVSEEGRQQTAVRKALQRAGHSGRAILATKREQLRKAQQMETIALHAVLKGKSFKEEVLHFAPSFGCSETLAKLVQQGKA